MFCTRCGIELRNEDKFCSQCGCPAGGAFSTPLRAERLTRPMQEAKLAGVCAGFARYFGVDVTLVRIVWCAISIWPLPLFGVVAYIVAWIVMPKDPLPLSAPNVQPANGGAH